MGFYSAYVSIVTLYLTAFMTFFFAAGVKYRNLNQDEISSVAAGTGVGAISMLFSLYAVNDARTKLNWTKLESAGGYAQFIFVALILGSTGLIAYTGWKYGTYHFKYASMSTLNSDQCADLAEIKKDADQWMFWAVGVTAGVMGCILVFISILFQDREWEKSRDLLEGTWTDATFRYFVSSLPEDKTEMLQTQLDVKKSGKGLIQSNLNLQSNLDLANASENKYVPVSHYGAYS